MELISKVIAVSAASAAEAAKIQFHIGSGNRGKVTLSQKISLNCLKSPLCP
jgi:hypothetical protein